MESHCALSNAQAAIAIDPTTSGSATLADMARAPTPWFMVEVPCEDWCLRVGPLVIAVILLVSQSLSEILGVTTHSLPTPRHLVTRTRLSHCLL